MSMARSSISALRRAAPLVLLAAALSGIWRFTTQGFDSTVAVSGLVVVSLAMSISEMRRQDRERLSSSRTAPADEDRAE